MLGCTHTNRSEHIRKKNAMIKSKLALLLLCLLSAIGLGYSLAAHAGVIAIGGFALGMLGFGARVLSVSSTKTSER
jgi:hypothetical protein